ncbi:MAG TPA: LamG-like jellyroll fold domain-containing protein, partial [Fimbriimonadaceae bacterium]|nr:LamG-like jellyroll fold domain-containing protein [Fimbriimonadaceae bacterium]
ILNDCKFASDKPGDDKIRLTMIYTPGTRGGYEDQGTQDIGKHHIVFAIAPHSGDWRTGQVPWQAQRLNQPLRAFAVSEHRGTLGTSISLLSSSSDQVEVQALKKAEDGEEIVVRLRELTGAEAKGVRLHFARPVQSARELNGQELQLGPAQVAAGELVADVPAFSLKTYAVKLAPAKARATQSRLLALPFDADVVSTRAKPADGEFANGRALAAECLPQSLTVDGIDFKLGPSADGAKNAVLARGQSIPLPGGYRRVYLLAAADQDIQAPFTVGGIRTSTPVRSWEGYVGQWDNRDWASDPGPNFSNYSGMNGLDPGYVKPGEVAWFASHSHVAGGNTFYEYTYLYKLGFDIPAGAKTLTLPNDPRIKVFAVTVAKDTHDGATPAAPLYDTLSDHVAGGAPSISPPGGSFSDATEVRLDPPLYYRPGGIRYTIDGTAPTASSTIYTGPFMLNDPARVTAAQFDDAGNLIGPSASADIDVHDTTPPSAVSASVVKSIGIAKIVFSEPVSRATAEAVANYKLGSGIAVTGANLAPDRRTVRLTLEKPLTGSGGEKVVISGVQDLAHTPNTMSATVDLAERGAVFTSPALEPKTSRAFQAVQGLPIHKGDTWTLNLWCRIDTQPEDRTMIAGFGRSFDGRVGTGRYFTKFPGGINFWVADRDVRTTTPLDTGKWQMLTATYDGTTLRVYKNGESIGERQVALEDDSSQVRVMPIDAWERKRRFGGEVKDLTVWDLDLSPAAVKRLWESGQH